MNRDVPGLVVAVDEIANQPMSIAVEVNSDEFTGPIDHRAAGVATDRVGSGNKVERCGQVQFGLVVQPAFGQRKWITVFLEVGTLERSSKSRGVRQQSAIDTITFDDTESQAQGKRRIR